MSGGPFFVKMPRALVSLESEKLKAVKAKSPVGLCLMLAMPAHSSKLRSKKVALFGGGNGGFGPEATPPPPLCRRSSRKFS